MLRWLIKHQWRASIRSITARQNLAAKVIVGLMLLILAANVLQLGFFAGRILEEQFPDGDPVRLINSILLYFLAIGLLLRLALQALPVQAMRPYLMLPVPRKLLVRWALGKSVFSLFNIVPLLFFVPVSISIVKPNTTNLGAATWLATIFLLILNSSFLTIYLRSRSTIQIWPILIVAFPLCGLILLDIYNFFSLSAVSASIFGSASFSIWSPLLLIVTLFLLYKACYSFLYANGSLERLSGGSRRNLSSSFGFLDRFGEWGNYLALELRLLLRNKRPRSSLLVVISLPLFAALYYSTTYSIDFYPKPDAARDSSSLLMAGGEIPITFRVRAGEIPEGASVYITGNHASLGEWKPDRIPLFEVEKGTWEREFSFPVGSVLEFKLTLGSWPTQRLLANGEIPENYTLTVKEQETVNLNAEKWRSPTADPFLQAFGIYVALLLTGTAMLAYGQFILGWESAWFAGMVCRKLDMLAYFRAKYVLMILIAVLSYLLCLPFCLFSYSILYQNTAAFLYNIGINSVLLLFLSSLSRKRFDLNASIFSTQGKSAVNYLVIMPTLILPALLYIPFVLTGYAEEGLVALSVLGVIALVLHPLLLGAVVGQYRLHRYLILEGFRQG